MSRTRRATILVMALPTLWACQDGLGPLPPGAEPLTPLPAYAEWWRMTEQCSKHLRDFDDIDWYVVPGRTFSTDKLKDVSGMSAGNRIVLARGSVENGPIVRHEMLHALIEKSGHPRAFFIGRCGLVVDCVAQCLTDSPAPPEPANAVDISASQLEVTSSIWPDAPDPSLLGGYFRLTVSARNPRDQPVVVRLPPSADDAPPTAFRYVVTQGSLTWEYDHRAWFPEMVRFAPGERKDMVFDFWARGVLLINVGTPLFRGGYGDNWALPIGVHFGGVP